MRTAVTQQILATVAAMLVSGSVGAGKDAVKDTVKLAQATPDEKKNEASAAPTISYKAPLRGAPATRVGGGTRSLAMKAVALSVLAPTETGYTTREQPTLYWYVSQALDVPVELTISSTEPLEAASRPALEIMLQPPVRKGLHALSLAEHGVTLKPGIEYQWFVAAVGNAAQRSNDVIAGGTIKRVAQDAGVQARLKQAPAASRPALYAAEGVWYDAIEELSSLIAAQPDNRELRLQRAALLEQVGLAEAGAFDRAALH
jgi:hypothetical protein